MHYVRLGQWSLLHQSNVEIQIDRVYTVSRASLFLPFSVEDAARSEAEVEASQVRTRRPGIRDWFLVNIIVEGIAAVTVKQPACKNLLCI